MSDQYRPPDELEYERSDEWGEPVTRKRRSRWGFVPWLVGGIVVLALAAGAGYGAALLIADMNAAPPPRTALPDSTPTPPPTERPAATASPEATPSPSPTDEPEETDEPLPTPTAEATPREHIVSRGESISLIAAEYGVTMDSIIELNELSNPNVIVPGQRLLIPPPSD